MCDSEEKLYILVRRDLHHSARAVQACHALSVMMLRHRSDPAVYRWAHERKTLVLLGVNDEDDLSRWEDELRARGIICEHFREPDIGNEKTALVVHPSVDKRLFRKLRLL